MKELTAFVLPELTSLPDSLSPSMNSVVKFIETVDMLILYLPIYQIVFTKPEDVIA